MSNVQEALKLAIDFIERYADRHGYHTDGKKVVDACKSALHEHEIYSVPVTYLKFYSYEAGLDRHEGFEEVSKHTEDAFPVYTAPQSLQEHDNEVIERCAKVCDEAGQPNKDEIHTDAQWAAKVMAANIRALKKSS